MKRPAIVGLFLGHTVNTFDKYRKHGIIDSTNRSPYEAAMSDIEKLNQILTAAVRITRAGKAHVFVQFSGHVDCLDVDAMPSTQVYQDGAEQVYLFKDIVHMGPWREPGKAAAELDALIAKLEALETQEV